MLTSTIGVDMDIRECERRVLEWATFVSQGGEHQARCGSVEGRYTPPRSDEIDAAAKARMPIDIDAAEQVERLMHSAVEPGAARLIKAIYVDRNSKHYLARKHSLSVDAIEERLVKAMFHVGRCIDAASEPVHVIRRGKPMWSGVAPAKRGGYIPEQLLSNARTLSPPTGGAVVEETQFKEPA